MRILYVTMNFPAPTETFAAIDVNTLIDAGHDVEVLCLKNAHSNSRNLLQKFRIKNSLKIHYPKDYYSVWHSIQNKTYLFFLLFEYFKSFSLKVPIKNQLIHLLLIGRLLSSFLRIKTSNYDVIHLFWGHYPSSLVNIIKKFTPHQVITMFLGAYDIEMRLKASQRASKIADTTFTHSYYNIEKFPNIFKNVKNFAVVHRGVDKNSIHKPAEFDKDELNVCYTGALSKPKGVQHLPYFLKTFSKKFGTSKLHIFGSGPEEDSLKKSFTDLDLAGHVIFHGYQSHDVVFKTLAESRYFVFPSQKPSERLPNAVKEAMAHECVVLCAASSGIEELVEDGKTGYVIDFENIQQEIERVHGNIISHTEISEMARSQILKNFVCDIQMKKYLSVWIDRLADSTRQQRISKM